MSRRVAFQGAVAGAFVVALPALADETIVMEDAVSAKKALQPLYKAAQFAMKSRVYTPGEVRFPEDFEQTNESPLVGKYSDPKHPGGTRSVTLGDSKLGIFQLAKVTGGGGKGEPASFTLPALVYGDRITVDFSPKGGPAGLTGTLVQGGIKWPDGNKWPRI